MKAVVSVRYVVATPEDYPEFPEYGQYTHEVEGVFDGDAYDAMMDEIIRYYRAKPESVVILNIYKLEEPPADVRMSAQSLMELQRIAAARAVIHFANTYKAERGDARSILVDAHDFALKVQKGEISW